MHEPEQHEMLLETTHPSGAEEWYCPTCGRRLLVQWPPGCETLALERGDKYVIAWGSTTGAMGATKVVLDPGHEHAIHRGNKSGLSLYPTPVTDIEENGSVEDLSVWEKWLEGEESELAEDLDVWQKWLEDVDFGEWEM